MMKLLMAALLVLASLAANPPQAERGEEVKKGDAKAGAQLYQTYCATCHGKAGKGDGPSAASLTPKPRNHTDKKYMSTESDEDLSKVIKGGGAAVGKSPLMPAWGATLKDDQVGDLVAYLRQLCKCSYKPSKK